METQILLVITIFSSSKTNFPLVETQNFACKKSFSSIGNIFPNNENIFSHAKALFPSTRFFVRTFFYNELQKPWNFEKMLRKSRASNAWAAILKSLIFSIFFLIQNSFLSSLLMVISFFVSVKLNNQLKKIMR